MSSIVKVDTIQENTSANGITVDGLNIKDSKLVTANSVVAANITADAIDATKIADNAISEEHLDVTAVTGHTAETSIADGDTILIHDASASALRKMTKANFVSGIGGTNTPLFRAYIGSSDQTIANNSWTKVRFDTESFDPSGVYDHSSNYRFTPAVAGYYSINAQVTSANVADWNTFALRIYKNGATIADMQVRHTYADSITISTMDLSDNNDYYEIYVRQNSGGNSDIRNLDLYNWFQAFKIIT
jgi:hypothetical protein